MISNYKTFYSLLFDKSQSKIFLVRHNNSITSEEYVVKSVPANETSKKESEIHLELSNSDSLILKYYEGWEQDQNFYHCMEYCELNNLQSQIKPSKRFIYDQVLNFCTQIARNLKVFHENQICHGDIKASNIFVTKSWKLKLGDFSSSKRVKLSKKEFNLILGSEPYIQNERLNGENYEATIPFKDDIWALGKVFLEIYLGEIEQYENVTNIYKAIETKLENNGSIGRFGLLIKKMMGYERSVFIGINFVLSELKSIFELRSHENSQIEPVYFKSLNCVNVIDKGNDCKISSKTHNFGERFSNLFSSISIDPNMIDMSAKILEGENKNSGSELTSSSIFPYSTLSGLYITSSINSSENSSLTFENQMEKEPFNKTTEHHILEIVPGIQLSILPLKKIVPINKKCDSEDLLIPNIGSSKTYPKCVTCTQNITSNILQIQCGHFFHKDCFINIFEPKLKKANKKIDCFKCDACNKDILFEYFCKLDLYSNDAKKYSKLQMLAQIKFECPNCNVKDNNYLLNEKLNFYDIICKNCNSRFCSFCSKRGSHYRSCNELNKI